jgi:hypothetical protein
MVVVAVVVCESCRAVWFRNKESRVLAIESVPKRVRFWVLISLQGGGFSPNPDATERCKHNLVIVPSLEYY